MSFSNKDFVHLHCHCDIGSLFDGAVSLHNLIHKARQMGFPAIGITDHGTVSGWIKTIKECSAKKDKDGKEIEYPTIKPILGIEAYMCRKMEWKDNEKQPEGKKGNRHIILVAKNFDGYKNICTLSEKSWIDGYYYSPRIDFDILAKYSQGVICQSACPSSIINANLMHGRYDQAKKSASAFKDIFGRDFFLEVMYHGIDIEKNIIPDIIKLGKELDVPLIASNDVHYLEKEHAKSHEILMCMNTRKCITNPNHLHFPYDEFYLKSAEEMGKMFGSIPDVIYNTLSVAERVDNDNICKNLFGSGTRLPSIDVPEEFKKNVPFEGQYAYLEHLAWQGMKIKGWDKSEKHIAQLKRELDDIRAAWESNDLDFATYFLIEHSIFDFAKKNNIFTGYGRGSAFASVLLHCIGIVYGIDPLDKTYDLLWERFLAFQPLRFIKDSDFGFNKKVDVSEISVNEEDENDIDNQEEEEY